MNLSILSRILLGISLAICTLACKKEVKKSDPPVIGYDSTYPFLYENGTSKPIAIANYSDDVNNNIPYYYSFNRIFFDDSLSTLGEDQVKAQAAEISNGSNLTIPNPLGASSKTGMYMLEMRAGDYQSNRSSTQQLFIYHPTITPNSYTDLTPFGKQDSAAFWEFNSRDTLFFKKFTINTGVGIKGISLYTLDYNSVSSPNLIGALRLVSPTTEPLRLDLLGGIPYTAAADTSYLLISLDDALGNSIIYAHPAVFR